jgi:hypothetical protein
VASGTVHGLCEQVGTTDFEQAFVVLAFSGAGAAPGNIP